MSNQIEQTKEEDGVPISHQDMKNIIQFLKDNNITASIEKGSAIEQLTEEFSPEELELVGAA